MSPLPMPPRSQAEGYLVLSHEEAEKFMALVTGETGYLSSTKATPMIDIRLTRVHYALPDVESNYEGLKIKFDFYAEGMELSLTDGQPAGGTPVDEEPSTLTALQQLRDGGNSCG